MECKLGQEMVAAYRSLAVTVQAQSFLLYALLTVTDRSSLQKVGEILKGHAATGEYQGVTADALQSAQQTFALLCESDAPVDPHKLFRLIAGGKDEHNSPAEKS